MQMVSATSANRNASGAQECKTLFGDYMSRSGLAASPWERQDLALSRHWRGQIDPRANAPMIGAMDHYCPYCDKRLVGVSRGTLSEYTCTTADCPNAVNFGVSFKEEARPGGFWTWTDEQKIARIERERSLLVKFPEALPVVDW